MQIFALVELHALRADVDQNQPTKMNIVRSVGGDCQLLSLVYPCSLEVCKKHRRRQYEANGLTILAILVEVAMLEYDGMFAVYNAPAALLMLSDTLRSVSFVRWLSGLDTIYRALL
jgi:hypothetical protein